MPRESTILKQILLALGSRPDLRVWRINVGAWKTEHGFVRSAPKGTPDICGILTGGFALFIETKSATGRQSKEQKAFQAMVERFGGCYVLARSVEEAEFGVAAFMARRLTGVRAGQ